MGLRATPIAPTDTFAPTKETALVSYGIRTYPGRHERQRGHIPPCHRISQDTRNRFLGTIGSKLMSLLLFLAPLGSPLDVSLGHVEGANIHSHLLSIEQRINAETGGHKKNE